MRAQVDHDSFVPGGGGPGGLRSLGASQVAQCHHGINRRDGQHQPPVQPLPVQAWIGDKGTGVAGLCLRGRHMAENGLHKRFPPGLRAFRAKAVGRPHGQGHTQHIDGGKQHIQPAGILVQMPHGRAQPEGVIQHNAFVDKHSAARHGKQQQNAPVALEHEGQSQQQKRREKVAFVHLDAQHIQQDEQHRAQQRHMAHITGADIHGQHNRKGHHHGGCANRPPACTQHSHDREACGKARHHRGLCEGKSPAPQTERKHSAPAKAHGGKACHGQAAGLLLNAGPVGVKQVIEVGCVDRCIGVGGQGVSIFSDQPSWLLGNAEGKDDQCRCRS